MMNKTLTLLVLSTTFLATAAPGCADDEAGDDDLTGEAELDVDGDGKADGVGTQGYFIVSIAAASDGDSPQGALYSIGRANRATLECRGEGRQPACHTDYINIGLLDITDSGRVKAGNVIKDAITADDRTSTQFVVRGFFDRTLPEMGSAFPIQFVATELWAQQIPQDGAELDGILTRISDTGLRCGGAICATQLAEKLNSSLASKFAYFDVADEAADERARTILGHGDQVITAGSAVTKRVSGRTIKGRTVSSLFVRLDREPRPQR